MRVRELMTPERDVITIEPRRTVATAGELLMRHGIGALPVVGPGRTPLGIVAERDLVRALQAHPDRTPSLPVERVMRRPPPLCQADDAVHDIMARMTRERARHLIVCDGGQLAGMLSVGDLLKHRVHELEIEAGVLRDYVAAQRSRF